VTALKHEFITNNQMPDLSLIRKITGDKTVRPHFPLTKYAEFTEFLNHWHLEPGAKDKDRRWLLRNYVIFMVGTGIRPGKEADQICWNDLVEKPNPSGEMEYLLIIPKTTKTGGRSISVNAIASTALNQIEVNMIGRGTTVKKDMPIFCTPDGKQVKHTSMRRTFMKALKACGMTENEKGERYVPYSMRGTYATYQLLYNKTSTHLLSKQMGCGEDVICDHYSRLMPEMEMAQLNSVTPESVMWDLHKTQNTGDADKSGDNQ